MKNWLPLLFGPALAIERIPALSWRGRMELVFELITRAAEPLAQRIAALDHEAFDDAMEHQAVVERFLVRLPRFRMFPFLGPIREICEVGDGLGRLVVENSTVKSPSVVWKRAKWPSAPILSETVLLPPR